MIDIIYHDGASAAPNQAGQSGGFAQADGNGEIHCYSWLDGVSAKLMRLEMESYTELRTQKGLLELNFCANGRFETRFSLRDHVLLKPATWPSAAMTACMARVPSRISRWAIMRASALRSIRSAPGAGSSAMPRPSVSIFPLCSRICWATSGIAAARAGPRCEHVFRELYESAAYLDPAFLRLKVLGAPDAAQQHPARGPGRMPTARPGRRS